MAAILFYSPFDQRSRDTESLMIAFKRQGHRVISLSQANGNQIHPYLQAYGIETYSHELKNKGSVVYYLRQLLYFVVFCKKHSVEIVYSHLEPANFVASIGQFFIRGKVYINRHHIDEAALGGFEKSLFYRLTYRLARHVIVVSQRAADYAVTIEKLDPKKILHINLAYDFAEAPTPNSDFAAQIRKAVSCEVLLVTACRFTKYKRASLSIDLVKRLVENDIDAKLILLGRGAEEESLKAYAKNIGVEHRLVMPGYVANICDYLAAADFLIHPSVLESSCVVVKEAALVNLPVIVCRGVGDFDEYLVDQKNAFLTSANNFIAEAGEIVKKNFRNKQLLKSIGLSLHEEVLDRFNITSIISKYESLNARG